MVGCGSFMFWQHLRSYQDWYWPVTVCTHGELYTYSAVPLWDQATSTMIGYPTQPHYPDTEPISHCPILIKSSNWLGGDKYTFWCHWLTRVQTPRSLKTGDGCLTHSAILSGHCLWMNCQRTTTCMTTNRRPWLIRHNNAKILITSFHVTCSYYI